MTGDRLLRGVGVSPGTAVGEAHVIPWGLPDIPHRVVPESESAGEIARLKAAIKAVQQHLVDLRERTAQRAGAEEALIFDTQILMLDDPEFFGRVEQLIVENQMSAERAFEFQTLELRALWAQADSALLRQRRADLLGVGVRLLHRLLGTSIEDALISAGEHPVIVITRELTPGLTIEFDRERVAGLASLEGTRTSHAAILAHSLGIPCVMGLRADFEGIPQNVQVVLDGTRGTLLLDPTPAEISDALAREAHRMKLVHELERLEPGRAETTDGVTITLRSNLDLPEELDQAADHGAEGVGLLRTEFLVMGRAELPSEDEQAGYFTRVAKRFAGQPVIIRSYDLGGDKFPAPFRPPREPNPFLGWRAIRVCLDQPEMFRTQIRALLRARAHGDVQLMLPLVTQLEELLRAQEIVAEVIADMATGGIEHRADLPVGVMIETPAAVLIAPELIQHADFISVGTNDLTQYTLAVDRSHAGVASRFTPLHPAVIRLLRDIVTAATAAGMEASVCGEMASDPLEAFLLIGLGFRVLSVAPPRIPLLRWIVRQIDTRVAAEAVNRALRAPTIKEVRDILTDGMGTAVRPELLAAGQLPDPSVPTRLQS